MFFLFLPAFSNKFSEFSVDQGRKVDNFLKKIAKKRKTVFLRKVTFSENDLNSYMNIFYAKKYAPEAKYIKFKLDVKNQVSGTIKIELGKKKHTNVPDMFRDIEIDFDGKIESSKSRMRFVFNKLRINGTSFSPELLDETFRVAQGNADIKKSLFDWFNLLPGIKRITTDFKEITFHY